MEEAYGRALRISFVLSRYELPASLGSPYVFVPLLLTSHVTERHGLGYPHGGALGCVGGVFREEKRP